MNDDDLMADIDEVGDPEIEVGDPKADAEQGEDEAFGVAEMHKLLDEAGIEKPV
jgi:hypothetical protein